MRTIIQIPENIEAALAEICRREKISRSEAIRRAINLLLIQEAKRGRARDTVFGIWKDRKIDSLKYEDKIRSEWKRK